MFQVYKSTEGRVVRWLFFLILCVACGLGLSKLYYNFPTQGEWLNQVWLNFTLPILDETVMLTPRLAICVGSAIVLFGFFIYLCCRNQGFSDFLIGLQNKAWGGYKTKQGLIVRWGMIIASALLFMFGCHRLYFAFLWFGWEKAYEPWATFTIPLVDILVKVSPALAIALGCGLFFVLFFRYLYFQNERISDFLIDTESEMRKVSWPTPGDVVKSSMAVVFIIFILGVYLFLVDITLDGVFSHLFKP
jgi:preprotein translocase SecE subunit